MLPEEEEKRVSAALAFVTSPGPWCFRFVAKQLGSLTPWQLSARRVMYGICFPPKFVAVVEEADFTVSAIFSWLPQDCYTWHCLYCEIHWDTTSGPLTFNCLQKAQLNETSCSTRPPPWTCRELHKRCDQSLWTVDWWATGTMPSTLESAQGRCSWFVRTISDIVGGHCSWSVDR